MANETNTRTHNDTKKKHVKLDLCLLSLQCMYASGNTGAIPVVNSCVHTIDDCICRSNVINIQYVHVVFDGNAFYFVYLLSKACMGDGILISGI